MWFQNIPLLFLILCALCGKKTLNKFNPKAIALNDKLRCKSKSYHLLLSVLATCFVQMASEQQ